MTDSITVTSDLGSLAADLGEAAREIGPYVNSAIQKTSVDIKESWQDKLAGAKNLESLAQAVSYDIAVFQGFGASVIQSEIGIDRDKSQGRLGNISEYGSAKIAPRNHGRTSLEEHEGDFLAGMEQAAADAADIVAARGIRGSASAVIRGGFR